MMYGTEALGAVGRNGEVVALGPAAGPEHWASGHGIPEAHGALEEVDSMASVEVGGFTGDHVLNLGFHQECSCRTLKERENHQGSPCQRDIQAVILQELDS